MLKVKTQKEFNAAYESGERVFIIVGFVAELWENSHAVLWDFTVAHLLSKCAKFKKGPSAHAIKPIYPSDIKGWCALKGIKVKNNRVQLWKCVDENGMDFYSGSINYNSNKEIVCPNWKENYTAECGYALHLADSPSAARGFVSCGKLKTARLFKVSAGINDCKCFGGTPDSPRKLRAKKCRKVKEYPIDFTEKF